MVPSHTTVRGTASYENNFSLPSFGVHCHCPTECAHATGSRGTARSGNKGKGGTKRHGVGGDKSGKCQRINEIHVGDLGGS